MIALSTNWLLFFFFIYLNILFTSTNRNNLKHIITHCRAFLMCVAMHSVFNVKACHNSYHNVLTCVVMHWHVLMHAFGCNGNWSIKQKTAFIFFISFVPYPSITIYEIQCFRYSVQSTAAIVDVYFSFREFTTRLDFTQSVTDLHIH